MSLRAEHISVRLGPTDALTSVTVDVSAGDMVAIVGPNGSGKSTLVRSLAGLLRPHAGRVLLDRSPIRSVPARARAARLGLLAQSAAVPGLTTVREHIGLGRHARRSGLRRWTSTDERSVNEAIETAQVAHLAQRRMEELSGGERQRVRLATLLAQDPDILLLDEPLTGLDIEHQLTLLHMLKDLHARGDRTIVCVLHDLDFALRFFPRVIVLHRGHLAADGPPDSVLCPRLFESVFRVDGRIGCELSGTPVVMCRRAGCGEQPPSIKSVSAGESGSPEAVLEHKPRMTQLTQS